ncbi:hypothetical protein CsSME_00039303 [Camellia sinensis var. sinensis]
MASQTQRQALAADGLDESVSIEIKQGDKRDICSLSNNKWLNSIMDARNEPRSLSIKSQKPKIQKAQPMLREVESNKKCYDPRVVSIGPCHHGKPELEPVQRLKIPLAREYCYAEGLTERFNYEEFAQMMFLDGCFILQYIYSIVNESHTVLKIIHHAPLVRRDLFLLENQLPFIVLQLKYAGIITNFLRNDEEVVKVIGEMAAGLVPDYRNSNYFSVMPSIEEYHSHKGKTRIASWIAEVMRDHFRSPWTAIAVLAALFAFFLTAVQTYYAAFPRTDKESNYLENSTLKSNGG